MIALSRFAFLWVFLPTWAIAFSDSRSPANSLLSSSSSSSWWMMNRRPRGLLRAAALPEDPAGIIENFYQTQPYVAAFLTCSVKASAADLMAQKRQLQAKLLPPRHSSKDGHKAPINNKFFSRAAKKGIKGGDAMSFSSEYDVSRNLGFICYGGLYQGMVQQFLFTTFYLSLFPFLTGWTGVLARVALDMGVTSPLVCLPLAYVFKALFTAEESSTLSPPPPPPQSLVVVASQDTLTSHLPKTTSLEENVVMMMERTLESWGSCVQTGLEKYIFDIQHQSLLLKYWSLWVPVQCLNMSVIPPHFRVVFVASVSFFWVFILSSIAANTPSEEDVGTVESS